MILLLWWQGIMILTKLIVVNLLCLLAFAHVPRTYDNFLFLNDANYFNEDPDVFRNVSQLITSKGYPVEEYSVQTADGYILGIQRIPNGRGSRRNRGPKKAIYLQHGLLGDSTNFVLNSAQQSLGFILADAGFDVWLGNIRGNTYSRKHIKYSPKDKEFWDFTFDEMAKYDLPAIIDFILNATKQSQLHYIGHSQGTTVMFALLAQNKQYNDKIKLGIAMAPVATAGFITSPIRYLAPFAHDLEFLFRVFGVNEFAPNKSLLHYLAEFVCDEAIRRYCENLAFLVGGIEILQFNETRFPVYFSHFPSGTSTLDVAHFAQLVNSRNFQKMDYGKEGNMKKYGQGTPPLYHVENITAPIALMWGLNDWLADPTDVALLAPKLKNLVVDYRVPFAQWTHTDFALGIDANKYVYPEVIKLINKY